MNRILSNRYFQVAQRVWGTKVLFVNVYMIANRPGSAKGWVLVDTGVKGSARRIIAMAEALFGLGTKPSAVILTHAHLDHAGGLAELLQYWKNVPVYAHELELPYLNGSSAYPPTDPFANTSLMSMASALLSHEPLKIRYPIKTIDIKEGIPELPEWRVIETPGHTPGHISLFLPVNSTLIAGDVMTTTNGSVWSTLTHTRQLSGPPSFGTTDWQQAAASVRKIADLGVRTIAVGHGQPMRGRELVEALHNLADNFEQEAVPSSGRYVNQPAVADETGVLYVPPFKSSTRFKLTVALTGFIAGLALVSYIRRAN